MVKVRYSVARITTLQTLGPGFTVWKDNANHHCKFNPQSVLLTLIDCGPTWTLNFFCFQKY